jgi:hypothetical protein
MIRTSQIVMVSGWGGGTVGLLVLEAEGWLAG